MTPDQVIMDKFVEQSELILKLKNENYHLQITILNLEKEILITKAQLEALIRKEIEGSIEKV